MTSTVADATSLRAVSAATGVRLGFVTAARRGGSRASVLLLVLALALVVSGGLIERRITSWGAVDRSLLSTFRLVVPLYCFALATAACQRLGLRDAAWTVARFGAARRDVATGIVLFLVSASALSGAVFSMAAVLSAYGSASRPLVTELFTCTWIGALVSAAYGAWFAFGSAFFDRGRGRWVPLVLDFLLGAGTSAISAFFPRSHARGLLGAMGPTHFSQPQSCIALIVMLLALSALAVVRARD